MDDQSAVDLSCGLAIPCLLCSLYLFIANYVFNIPFRCAQTAHRQCRIVALVKYYKRLFSGLEVGGWNGCGRMMEELGVTKC